MPVQPAMTPQAMLEMVNIADMLDDAALGKIGNLVYREYEIDKQSRNDWEQRMSTAVDMAMQV